MHFVSETAQVELKKWTSVSPCREPDLGRQLHRGWELCEAPRVGKPRNALLLTLPAAPAPAPAIPAAFDIEPQARGSHSFTL